MLFLAVFSPRTLIPPLGPATPVLLHCSSAAHPPAIWVVVLALLMIPVFLVFRGLPTLLLPLTTQQSQLRELLSEGRHSLKGVPTNMQLPYPEARFPVHGRQVGDQWPQALPGD